MVPGSQPKVVGTKLPDCKRAATNSMDDLTSQATAACKSLRWLTNLSKHSLAMQLEHNGTCVVIRLGSPTRLDVRKKWQFWTIATSETNLYGARCYSTRAESMFERHSTQQTRQAQSRPKKNKEALTESS